MRRRAAPSRTYLRSVPSMARVQIRDINLLRFLSSAVLLGFCGLVLLHVVADVMYMDPVTILDLVRSSRIQSAFVVSFVTSITATAISLAVAVPAAYALSRYEFRGKMALDILVDLLIVLPTLVIGMNVLVLFRLAGDMTESSFFLMRWLGRASEAATDFFIFSVPGIVLAQFLCAVSFAIRAIKATFDGIDPRKESVAMTLGCSPLGAFRRVTLPLAKPGIMAGGLLSWARAFGAFGAVKIVGGTIKGRTEILPTTIYLEVEVGNINNALGVALIILFSAAAVLVCVRLVSGKSVFGT